MFSPDRKVLYLSDWDGVRGKTPIGFHWATAVRELCLGHLRVPSPDNLHKIGERIDELECTRPDLTLKNKLVKLPDWLWHSHRGLRPRSFEALTAIHTLFTQAEYDIAVGILTGRKPHLHRLTTNMIERKGFRNLVDDLVFLNPGVKSTEFKMFITDNRVKEGFTVIAEEDDVEAALAMAQTADLVYLWKAPSNHPILMKHLDVSLPSNIVSIGSHSALLEDLSNRIVKS